MKKTFTINISGTIFHIEDDAYEVLQKYLINLRNHFGNGEEGKEILADIEARIAEIFIEKSTDEKSVVTIEMVNDIIEIMGTPEDITGEEGDDDTVSHDATRKRRLYRDPEHRVFGGVSSGLAAYFNMDMVIIRVLFVVLFLATGGVAILAYIVLWIAVPKATNTAQRLEMRGQEATVKNIEKSIKEEVAEVKESYKKFKESDSYSKGKRTVEGAGDVAYNVTKVILKVIVIAIGVFLIISGVLGLLGFISSMIIGHSFVQGWPIIWGPEIHIPGYLNHFVDQGDVSIGLIAVGFLTGIPLLAILFIGTKLVFSYKTNNKAIGLSMVGVWLISLVVLIVISAGQFGNFKKHTSMLESSTIPCDSCQTIYLKLAEDKYEEYPKLDFEMDNFEVAVVDGEEVMLGHPQLDIKKSWSNHFTILIKKSARGATRGDAKTSAENIIYHYQVKDSVIYFDPEFILDTDEKWRNQDVDIILKVPEGKTVFIGDDMAEIIYDIKNTTNTYDADMVGKFWKMTPDGLTLKE